MSVSTVDGALRRVSQPRANAGDRLALASCTLVAFAYGAFWLLSPTMSLGTGGNDVLFIADGARRIAAGQWPHVDFPLPVGSLPYFAYHWAERFLPQMPAYLGMHLFVFILCVPLVAAAARSLSAPAVLFVVTVAALAALAPFNLTPTDPAAIAFHGAYNRFAAAVAFLWLVWLFGGKPGSATDDGLIVAYTAGLLLSLKFVFLGVMIGPLVVLSLVDGHRRRTALIGLAILSVAIVALDAATGMARGYLADVRGLAAVNGGGIAYFIGSFLFRNLLPFGLLVALIALPLAALRVEARRVRSRGDVLALCRHAAEPVAALAGLLGVVVGDSQSTGGLELVPALGLLFAPSLTAEPRTPLRLALAAAIAMALGGALASNAFRKSVTVALHRQGPVAPVAWVDRFLGHMAIPAEMRQRGEDLAQLWTDASTDLRRLETAGRTYVPVDYDRYLPQWKTVDDAIRVIPNAARSRLGVVTTLTMTELFGIALAAPPAAGHHLALDAGRIVARFTPTQADAYLTGTDTVFEPTCAIADGLPDKSVASWFSATLAREFVSEPLTPCWTMHRRLRPADGSAASRASSPEASRSR